MLKMPRLFRPLAVLAAVASVSLLTACMNDDDGPRTLTARYTGALASLDSLPSDSVQAFRSWHLPVDLSDDPELRGNCMYNAGLGDSMEVEQDSAGNLYTNTQMGGRVATAEQLRLVGIQLTLSTAEPNPQRFTHYRVDFRCEY